MGLFNTVLYKWQITLYISVVTVFVSVDAEVLQGDTTEPQCYSRFDYEYKVVQKLVQLEESQKLLKETIETQRETLSKQANEIQRLSTRAERSESLINTLQQQTRSLDTLKQKLHNTTTMVERINSKYGSSVAFSAYRDETKAFSDAAITFDHVLINEPADVYNPTSGIFTCPVTGVYMLAFVIATRGVGEGRKEVFAQLKVNNEVIVQAVSESDGNADDVQGGNLAIVTLNAGDKIYVSAKGTIPGNTWDLTKTRTSSFSGFLLYAKD